MFTLRLLYRKAGPLGKVFMLALILFVFYLHHRPRIQSRSCNSGKELAVSTHVAIPGSTLTARQHVEADKIGNQVYSAHYSERSMAKIAIGALAGISFCCAAGWSRFRIVPSSIATSALMRRAGRRRSSTPT